MLSELLWTSQRGANGTTAWLNTSFPNCANVILADCTAARSAIGYCHDAVVCLSVTKCIVALWVGVGG